MVSVLIRNRNEGVALEFLLHLLTRRYKEDIGEIIVVDNASTDNSREIIHKYGCKLVELEQFGYGIALNLGISNARFPIVVNLSAHCYPVNKDFFKIIVAELESDLKLAGVRFLQGDKDYRNFLAGKTARTDLKACGLANACSAIRKELWEQHPFHDTMFAEDKEWTRHFLEKGYDIKLCESFVSYHIKRSKQSSFNRYKAELQGHSMLFGKQISFKEALSSLWRGFFGTARDAFFDTYFVIKKFFFHLSYITKYKG